MAAKTVLRSGAAIGCAALAFMLATLLTSGTLSGC
jgi:hypothetical protein